MTDLPTHVQTLRQQRDALPPGEDRDRLDDHLSDLEAGLREQEDEACALYPVAAAYRLGAPGLTAVLTDEQFHDPDDRCRPPRHPSGACCQSMLVPLALTTPAHLRSVARPPGGHEHLPNRSRSQ